MDSFKLNPYITFVESHLTSVSQYAVFHRLTGELIETHAGFRSLLSSVKNGVQLPSDPEELAGLGDAGRSFQRVIGAEILIRSDADPLSSLLDHYVVRPLQNPAVTYRQENGQIQLVRMSMEERVYSPEPNHLPTIVEEELPALAMQLLAAADGTLTLKQIYARLRQKDTTLESDHDFRSALDLLTNPERQLIKFAPAGADLSNPFLPFNTVPRNFYHSAKWPATGAADESDDNHRVKEFHRKGIADPSWEFDVLEPTINHALRFPSTILGGLDYGARFCRATMAAEIAGARGGEEISVLEVGGGTGSFAKSFINEAQPSIRLKYHILELSPALIEAQRQSVPGGDSSIVHFEQDATEFDLPLHRFDLILANEVIADFPVALVERDQSGANELGGDGAAPVRKYQLSIEDAPQNFYVNSGVFRFLERAWLHLKPGGMLIMSEYGSETRYPSESFHLNHAEFSIQFRHVSECARRIGFECRLRNLREFLSIDDNVPVLNGREEHLMCLRHVFVRFGFELPFALFSESDFMARYAEVAARNELQPIRFLPLRRNFHYGPGIDEFLVLMLNRPAR